MKVANPALVANPLFDTYITNMRKDLTASDIETVGTGRYVIATVRPPPGSVILLKSIIPYASARIDVGSGEEDYRAIDPLNGNGHFLYTPEVNQGGPLINSDLNVPANVAPAPANKPTQALRAIDNISLTPYVDLLRTMDSEAFNILIDDGSVFRMIFQLAQSNTSNPYVVGGVVTNKRVDFAGVYLGGVQVQKQHYDRLAKALWG